MEEQTPIFIKDFFDRIGKPISDEGAAEISNHYNGDFDSVVSALYERVGKPIPQEGITALRDYYKISDSPEPAPPSFETPDDVMTTPVDPEEHRFKLASSKISDRVSGILKQDEQEFNTFKQGLEEYEDDEIITLTTDGSGFMKYLVGEQSEPSTVEVSAGELKQQLQNVTLSDYASKDNYEPSPQVNNYLTTTFKEGEIPENLQGFLSRYLDDHPGVLNREATRSVKFGPFVGTITDQVENKVSLIERAITSEYGNILNDRNILLARNKDSELITPSDKLAIADIENRAVELQQAYAELVQAYPDYFERRTEEDKKRQEAVNYEDGDDWWTRRKKDAIASVDESVARVFNAGISALSFLNSTGQIAIRELTPAGAAVNPDATTASDEIVEALSQYTTRFLDRTLPTREGSLFNEGKINSEMIAPLLAGTLTDMGVLAFGGSLGGASKAGKIAGLVTASAALEYEGMYREMLDAGMAKSDAQESSAIISTMIGGLEAMAFEVPLTSLINKRNLKILSELPYAQKQKYLWSEALRHVPEELMQEFTQTAAEGLGKAVVNSKFGTELHTPDTDEYMEVALLTAAATTIFGKVRGGGVLKRNREEMLKEISDPNFLSENQDLLNVLTADPLATQATLTGLLANGSITKDQFDIINQTVENASKEIPAVEENQEIPVPEVEGEVPEEDVSEVPEEEAELDNSKIDNEFTQHQHSEFVLDDSGFVPLGTQPKLYIKDSEAGPEKVGLKGNLDARSDKSSGVKGVFHNENLIDSEQQLHLGVNGITNSRLTVAGFGLDLNRKPTTEEVNYLKKEFEKILKRYIPEIGEADPSNVDLNIIFNNYKDIQRSLNNLMDHFNRSQQSDYQKAKSSPISLQFGNNIKSYTQNEEGWVDEKGNQVTSERTINRLNKQYEQTQAQQQPETSETDQEIIQTPEQGVPDQAETSQEEQTGGGRTFRIQDNNWVEEDGDITLPVSESLKDRLDEAYVNQHGKLPHEGDNISLDPEETKVFDRESDKPQNPQVVRKAGDVYPGTANPDEKVVFEKRGNKWYQVGTPMSFREGSAQSQQLDEEYKRQQEQPWVSVTESDDVRIFNALYGSEKAEVTNTLFQRGLKAISKRLGVSMDVLRKRMSLVRTDQPIDDTFGFYSSMDNRISSDLSETEVYFQDEIEEELFRQLDEVVSPYGPWLDMFDNLKYGFPHIIHNIIKLSKGEVQESMRQKVNILQKQVGQLFKEGKHEEARRIVPELNKLKESLRNAERSGKKVTFEQAETLVRNEIEVLKTRAYNGYYLLTELTDKWIDDQIAYYTTIGDVRVAQSFQRIKEDSSLRERAIEEIRGEQLAVIKGNFNYLYNNPDYDISFQLRLLNIMLKRNLVPVYQRDSDGNLVYDDQNNRIPTGEEVVVSRTNKTVGNPIVFNGAAVAWAEQAKDDHGDVTDVELLKFYYEGLRDRGKLDKTEIDRLKKQYVYDERPDGTWIKIPQGGNAADLNYLASDSNRLGGEWCTGGAISTAESQLSQGDFYLFIDNDNNVQLAARYSGSEMDEPMRGNNPGQGIPSQWLNEAEYFMSNNPGAKAYLDRVVFTKLKRKYYDAETDTYSEMTPDDIEKYMNLDTYNDGSYQRNDSYDPIRMFKANKNVLERYYAEKEGLSPDEIYIDSISDPIDITKKMPKIIIGSWVPAGRGMLTAMSIDLGSYPGISVDFSETKFIDVNYIDFNLAQNVNVKFGSSVPENIRIDKSSGEFIFSSSLMHPNFNFFDSKVTLKGLERINEISAVVSDIVIDSKDIQTIYLTGFSTLNAPKLEDVEFAKLENSNLNTDENVSVRRLQIVGKTSSTNIKKARNLEYSNSDDLQLFDIESEVLSFKRVRGTTTTTPIKTKKLVANDSFVQLSEIIGLEHVFEASSGIRLYNQTGRLKSIRSKNGYVIAPNLESIDNLHLERGRFEGELSYINSAIVGHQSILKTGENNTRIDTLHSVETQSDRWSDVTGNISVISRLALGGAIIFSDGHVEEVSEIRVQKSYAPRRSVEFLSLGKINAIEVGVNYSTFSSNRDAGTVATVFINNDPIKVSSVRLANGSSLLLEGVTEVDRVSIEGYDISSELELESPTGIPKVNKLDISPKTYILSQDPNTTIIKGFSQKPRGKRGLTVGDIKRYMRLENQRTQPRDFILLEKEFSKKHGVSRINLFQDKRGAFIKDGDNRYIFLGKDSDVTTPMHELAHMYEEVLTDNERQQVLNWAGHTTWTRDTSEAFAKGFEKFLYLGDTFNNSIEGIFKKFSKWVKEAIQDAVSYFGGINELNDEMIAIYESILGMEEAELNFQRGRAKPEGPTSQFGERVIRDERLPIEFRKYLDDSGAINRQAISMGVTDNVADRLIEHYMENGGVDEVINVVRDESVPGEVRVMMAMKTGRRLIEEGSAQTDDLIKTNLYNKATSVLSEAMKIGTLAGRTVQIFSAFNRMDAAGFVNIARTAAEQILNNFAGTHQNLADKIIKEHARGKQSAARDFVQQTFSNKEAKVYKAYRSARKQKAAEIRKQAADKIKKSRENLSFGGLSPELIEGLIEYGYSLVLDGVTTFNDFARKIRKEFDFLTSDQISELWHLEYEGRTLEDYALNGLDDIQAFFEENYGDRDFATKLARELGISEQLAKELDSSYHKFVKQELNKRFRKPVSLYDKSKSSKITEELTEDPFLTVEKVLAIFRRASNVETELSDETIAEIIDNANAIQGLPDDSEQKNEAIAELLAKVKSQFSEESVSYMNKSGITDNFYWSLWYASILSGASTQAMNIGANLVKFMTRMTLSPTLELTRESELPTRERLSRAGILISSMLREIVGKKSYFKEDSETSDPVTGTKWFSSRAHKDFRDTLLEGRLKRGTATKYSYSGNSIESAAKQSWLQEQVTKFTNPGQSVTRTQDYASLKQIGSEIAFFMKMPLRTMAAFDALFYWGNYAGRQAQVLAEEIYQKEVDGAGQKLVGKALRDRVREVMHGGPTALAAVAFQANEEFRYTEEEVEGMRQEINELRGSLSSLTPAEAVELTKQIRTKEATLKRIEENDRFRILPNGRQLSSRDVDRRIEEILEQRIEADYGPDIRRLSHQQGLAGTYQQRPEGYVGRAVDTINNVTKAFPALRFIIPFTTTLGNVLNDQIDFTPIGSYRYMKNKDKIGEYDFYDAEGARESLYKSILGGILTSAFAYLLLTFDPDDEDNKVTIHGSGPKKFEDVLALRAAGWQPFSIEVKQDTGPSVFLSYKEFNIGLALSIMGNLFDNTRYGEEFDSEGSRVVSYTNALSLGLVTAPTTVFEASFMSGIAEFTENLARIQDVAHRDPSRLKDELFKSVIKETSPLIPNFFRQIDKALDPTWYSAPTAEERLIRTFVTPLPGDGGLRPYRNPLGDKVPARSGTSLLRMIGANRFVNIGVDDDVYNLLREKNVFVEPLGYRHTINVDGELVELFQYDRALFDRLSQIRGEMLKTYIRENLDRFNSMTPGDITEDIKKESGKITVRAKNILKKEMKK